MDKRRAKAKGKKRGANGLHRGYLIAIFALLAILLTLVAVFFIAPALRGAAVETGAAGADWFDPAAEAGSLPGKSQEEIQAELNKIVEEGMFNISIASTVYMDSGDGPALARIENIEANRYHMSVSITLDDTGETVYASKGIQPGQYIEYITLTKTLEKGYYNATALFTAHTKDDFSPVGQAAAKIQIVVEN